MNPSIQLKRITSLFFIVLGFVGLGPLPKTLAVSPPPDGAYPGFNTAEGQDSLFSLTAGIANTGIGWFSLKSDTGGV